MISPPRFVENVADLPTHAFSHRSLTWWGVMGFMVIEATGFGLVAAAYFFLMSHEADWTPRPSIPPDLLFGSLFTILILLSEIPNTMIKKAAAVYDVSAIRRLFPIFIAMGFVLLIIRGFEFNSLNVMWYDSAYGSIIWALLLLHTTHIGTDWVDSVVLWLLIRTPHGHSPRRIVDCDENSLYWRFVWLIWIPIYLLLYWVPRMFR